MTAYKFVVLTNAVEGREAEFNDWYDNQHLGDVLRIPGIVAAQRFVTAPVQRGPKPLPYKYIAIYELETDNLTNVMGELGRRSGTAEMPMSDAMAAERTSYIVEAITDRRTAK